MLSIWMVLVSLASMVMIFVAEMEHLWLIFLPRNKMIKTSANVLVIFLLPSKHISWSLMLKM
jgi:hypothetical protein